MKKKSDILLELSNIAREIEVLTSILKETESFYFKSTELTGIINTTNYNSELDQFNISIDKALTTEVIKTLLRSKEVEYLSKQKELFDTNLKEA
mgnify:CR=1 FL=1